MTISTYYSKNSCEEFLNSFEEALSNKVYLHVESSNYHQIYSTTKTKPRDIKTRQIIEVSKKCLDFLKNESELNMQDKLTFISRLNKNLVGYSERVMGVIKQRWWYAILSLFGYQAKAPKDLHKALAEVHLLSSDLKKEEERIYHSTKQLIPAKATAHLQIALTHLKTLDEKEAIEKYLASTLEILNQLFTHENKQKLLQENTSAIEAQLDLAKSSLLTASAERLNYIENSIEFFIN